jgi:hypothetical protein
MKKNPIFEAIRESYIEHGVKTERAVFAMLMTKSFKSKVKEDTSIFEFMHLLQETSHKNTCVNFAEGELTFQNNYEVHSVSASRDEDGDPEVFIHMLDMDSMETMSVRVYQFPEIHWLLQIIEAVHDKCDLTINAEEDEED